MAIFTSYDQLTQGFGFPVLGSEAAPTLGAAMALSAPVSSSLAVGLRRYLRKIEVFMQK